mgnify:FL=1
MKKIFDVATKERLFDVTETIRLLTSYGYKYFSWGCSKAFQYKSKGLLLRVNGMHLKGYVWIYLGYDDTYGVEYYDLKGNKVFESDKTIYFDELFNTIDRKIEYIDAYSH